MLTVINASAAVTLLEQRPEKNFQALSGIRTHDLCDASAVLSCGFDSSVGRALHWPRRGRGFESRSEPGIFFQCYGRTCINDRYHSIATLGQITFIL